MSDDFRIIIVVDSNDQRLVTISPRKLRPFEVDVFRRIEKREKVETVDLVVEIK